MKCYFKQEIYKNNENGFRIIVYETDDPTIPKEARREKINDKFTIIAKGYNLPITPSVEIEIAGSWVDGGQYGMQLNVEGFTESLPTSKAGIIGFLSSGLISNIGPKLAETIYEKFGDKAIDILENNPSEYLQIKGITPEKLKSVVNSYQESKSLKDIVTFLSPYGISLKKAAKIKTAFGADAYQIIKNNPFKLCSVKGFGFTTVDQIARKLNCSLKDPLRIQAGILYALEEAASQKGHLFLKVEVLGNESYQLLNKGFGSEIISVNAIKTEINSLVKAKEIFYDKETFSLYKWRKFMEEDSVADKIAKLIKKPNQNIKNLSKYISKAQKALDIILSEEQINAVKMCLTNNLSIITGGPGTGKSATRSSMKSWGII